MLSLPATGFNEDEALRAFYLIIIQCTSLAVFYCQIICSPVDEFKGGQDFRELLLDLLEKW